MPGYILHLTAAKMLLNKVGNKISENDFLFGNLLPDTVKDKAGSHFRDPKRLGKRIEYPELRPFQRKYKDIFEDASVLGYFYHLYIDRKYFTEYIPKLVTFLDADKKVEDETAKVVWAQINHTGEIVPIKEFFSESYYYGDFTKMNTYLVKKYGLPMMLDTKVENPGIEEVDYGDVSKVLDELQGYLQVPEEAVRDLNVFDLEDLLAFLENAAEEWKQKRELTL